MKRLVYLIILGVTLALIFRHFCFEVIYIASASMEPTYNVGDQLIVNKTAYLFRSPKGGDVVLIDAPFSGKGMVKRIVGLPGEVLSIEDKQVYINDELLEEEYVQYLRADTILVGDNIEPFTIPSNQYFVMGDNRDMSRDSRDWLEEEGIQMETISINKIKGKVL